MMLSFFSSFVPLTVFDAHYHSHPQVQGALDTGIPTHISYGFVSGFCSGMALKKVGKAVSVVLGTYYLQLAGWLTGLQLCWYLLLAVS